MKRFNRALILAPHTDDGEFGCGATISSLLEQGTEVYYVAFSACEQSVKEEFPRDILITEVKAATQKLGIAPDHLLLFQYAVRTFSFHRQEILEDMIRLRNELKPDLILMPSLNDIHQDHQTIATEGVRAFKFSSILCYEMPWNNFNFNTTAFVKLEEKHVKAKVDALAEYKSQRHRPYANEEFIRSLARTRGVQIDTYYAEVFEVVRWIL